MANNRYRRMPTSPRLSSRTQVRLSLAAIFVLVFFFMMIVWPQTVGAIPGFGYFQRFYPHLGLDLQGGTHLVYEADLSAVSLTDKDSSLEGARDVIERRVNALGVAEPVVQTTQQAGHARVIVELAGVTDVNQAIKIIGETPLLEFKELGRLPDAEKKPTAEEINTITEENKKQEQLARDVLSRIRRGESFEELAKQYSADEANKAQGGDLGFVIRGLFTPLFDKAIFEELKVGELRSEPLKTEFGFHIIKKIDERTNEKGELEVRSAHILFPTRSLDQEAGEQWINTQLSGKHLKRAQVTFDPQTNQPDVSLVFNSEGAALFEEITRRNLQKQVGIFLDGAAISAPVVQSVISGGQAIITGNFTIAEAKILSQRLNAGALPVPVQLVSQQTVGPTLGKVSLEQSLKAGLVGLIAVAVFMTLFYFLPGIISVLALLIYALVALGIFISLPVTLTLAGIAGFVLSIGMAVDANVLIFERLKEELRAGNSYVTAVEEGFRRAWPSIRDSNVSSLITCIILFWFGSSIIKGFAVTLGIGIIVSMFSAITVTRTFLRLIITRRFVQRPILFGVRKKYVSPANHQA